MKTARILTLIVLVFFILAGGIYLSGRKLHKGVEEEVIDEITLRFVWWGSEERAERTIRALKLFEEKNPGIHVQTRWLPFDEYEENLRISALSGHMPDVYQGFIGAYNHYIEEGYAQCLDPYVENGLIDVGSISEELLYNGKLGGKLYGLSLGCNARCLALDAEAYERAGLDIPEVAYDSWDDLKEDLLQLQKVTGGFSADDLFDREFMFTYFMEQRGEAVYGENNTIGFSLESFREFFRLRKEWIEEGLLPPYPELEAYQNLEDSLLVKGQAAVRFCYSNELPQLEGLSGRKFELILMPGALTGRGMEVRSSQHICMSATSENQEAAARLIDFLVNDVDANRILNAERGIPASAMVRDALRKEYGEQEKKMERAVTLAEEYARPQTARYQGNTEVFDAMLANLEEEIMYGEITVERAYRQLAEYGSRVEQGGTSGE